MPPDDGDSAFLADMLKACDRIASFVAGRSLEDYCADAFLRSAVERQVEIVGEAARRISDAMRSSEPDIPWRQIIAQRHILAHEYGEIQHELIWRVATIHVPALAVQIRALLDPGTESSDVADA